MPCNPCVDPQPGDRVRASRGGEFMAAELLITKRDGNVIRYKDAGFTGREFDTEINEWRSWCRRNRAERVEEGK